VRAGAADTDFFHCCLKAFEWLRGRRTHVTGERAERESALVYLFLFTVVCRRSKKSATLGSMI
jgi:hypothetical protein